jgi:heme-degrading monooxygenase HmoA
VRGGGNPRAGACALGYVARIGTHHLAQVNIARLLAPIDSPQLAEFVAGLEPVNALADAAPGFVWRLQDDAGDATAIRPYDDERIMVNLSVWESLDALRSFVQSGEHVTYLRRRRAWFERLDRPVVALWWVRAGEIPSVADAKDRLELLERVGPTPAAFTFRTSFPAPEPDAARP